MEENNSNKHNENQITNIPTVDYLIKNYAKSSNSEDQKASRIFLDFETREKLQRLRSELLHIKSGQVSQAVLDQTIGAARKVKYNSYENWAAVMLQYLLKK